MVLFSLHYIADVHLCSSFVLNEWIWIWICSSSYGPLWHRSRSLANAKKSFVCGWEIGLPGTWAAALAASAGCHMSPCRAALVPLAPLLTSSLCQESRLVLWSCSFLCQHILPCSSPVDGHKTAWQRWHSFQLHTCFLQKLVLPDNLCLFALQPGILGQILCGNIAFDVSQLKCVGLWRTDWCGVSPGHFRSGWSSSDICLLKVYQT